MFALAAASAHAQGAGARQQVQLQLNPAIELSSYSDINISSAGSQFRIRANKEFNISVSTTNTTDKLQLAIQDNETGGMPSAGFTAYAAVQSSPKDLLTNCAYGNDRSFAVNYKAAGAREATLLYTATQP